ncbi:MAG: HlyD family efflux transporter periplasmic adaptor subunit [Sandaracinaceae bacterium]|nr:HlyD family efflux transporter periplasmic adaptor subunit [Sandaracinaceae bacterium]
MNKRVIGIVAVALVALLAAARVRANLAAEVVSPEAGEIRRATAARATVVPADGVFHVAPAVNGRVREVLVRVGDRVERDQELARVEPSGGSQPFDILGEGESLRSPAAGVVLSRNVEPGDLLGTVVPSTLPLFEIADPERLELRLEIDARDADAIAVGTVVRVAERETTIDRVSPRIERREHPLDDVMSRASGRVRVAWARVPEGAELPIGASVDVVILGAPRAVEALLPREAVAIRDGRAIVRVRDGLFIDELPVTLGEADDVHVAVEGLPSGAAVVLP